MLPFPLTLLSDVALAVVAAIVDGVSVVAVAVAVVVVVMVGVAVAVALAVGTVRSVPALRGSRHSRPRPHHVTSASASITMTDDIFDSPAARSMKVIGTSRYGGAALLGPVRHLDLEAVALGLDAVEVQSAQDVAA